MLDKFFKENSVKNKEIPSAAALAQFKIKLMKSPDIDGQLNDMMNDIIYKEQPNREETVMAEKAAIEALSTAADVIRCMRRSCDPINQAALVYRALAFEDETIPEIIRMLKTSLNTSFIECSARVLSLCEKDIADELVDCFDDIRSPYAQSMTMVVLGFKADEKHIPWMIEKYKEFKRKYPDETHSDSVIYALDEIEDRVYS